MEEVVNKVLCDAVLDMPVQKKKASMSLRLEITDLGCWVLGHDAGRATVNRCLKESESGDPTVVVDATTLTKLANKSLTPIRALASGKLKLSKGSKGEQFRDQRQAMGSWIQVLRRVGEAIDSNTRHEDSTDARNTSFTSAHISAALNQPNSRSNLCLFEVQVTHQTDEDAMCASWTLQKRFEDFQILRGSLLSKSLIKATFPKTSSFFSTPTKTLSKQRAALDAWIREVSSHAHIPSVADFLEISRTQGSMNRNNLQPEISQTGYSNGDDVTLAGVRRILTSPVTYKESGYDGRERLMERIHHLERNIEEATTHLFSFSLDWFPMLSSALTTVSVFIWLIFFSGGTKMALFLLAIQPLTKTFVACIVVGIWMSSPDLFNVSIELVVPVIIAARGLRYLWTERGLRRAFHVYFVAVSVIGTYLSLKIVVKKIFRLSDVRTNLLYATVDSWMAPFVAQRFINLKSVWVKIGQYISGRSDMSSPTWQNAFSEMQSDMPADSITEVRFFRCKGIQLFTPSLRLCFRWTPLSLSVLGNLSTTFLILLTSNRLHQRQLLKFIEGS
jgi:putative sterol carrier protein